MLHMLHIIGSMPFFGNAVNVEAAVNKNSLVRVSVWNAFHIYYGILNWQIETLMWYGIDIQRISV
jgi:hypothetical protein